MVQLEWFRISSAKMAQPSRVSDYLMAFSEVSSVLLEHVVNMTDGNGNTALHYSVSHSNFGVVGLLLDTGSCSAVFWESTFDWMLGYKVAQYNQLWCWQDQTVFQYGSAAVSCWVGSSDTTTLNMQLTSGCCRVLVITDIKTQHKINYGGRKSDYRFFLLLFFPC